MVKLVIGTTNEAKIKQIRGALAPVGIEVNGLPKDMILPKVVEDGKNAQENARKKALIYSGLLKQTVLSMDNALYLDGLSAERQPALNVRRIPGHDARPSDDELLQYYSELIGVLGDRIKGRWEFAICIAKPNGRIHEATVNSPRIFVKRPCAKIILGYPLESIQIDPESNKYIAEMSQTEQDLFWQRVIGKELCDFVCKNI